MVLFVLLSMVAFLPGRRAQAADPPPRQERTDVIFTPGGLAARVYDPTVDDWIDLQTPDPIVAVVTGNLRRDALFSPPNFRDQPDDMPLNNGVLIATSRQLIFYEPTANTYIPIDLPPGEHFTGANVSNRRGEVLAVAHSDKTAFVYNASRNAWLPAPALSEGLNPNFTQVSSTGAIVASQDRALIFDPVRNDWGELDLPPGQTIQATGIPAFPEPGLTLLVVTDSGAYTYDGGTDQWIGHTMPGPVRVFAVAEASPVIASEHAVAVYDPVTNQWVQQGVGHSVAIPRNGVLASRNTALAVTPEAGYIYNRSRHQWEQVPAPANQSFSGFATAENTGVFWTAEGTAYVYDVNRQQFVEGKAPPNAQIVSGTMNQNLAVLTTDEGALIYDPGTNQWSQFQVPRGDIPTPPGAPNFNVSRFTTMLNTNTHAWVWNPGTHQFDQVKTDSNIRLTQTSENAAVVATDNGAYVYDPTMNQWVEVRTPLANEPITGIDTARNTVVVRSDDNAWFYNRSTHQWVELAAPANETWNVQMALENTAVVCSERNAAVWDPTRDEWVQLNAGGDASVLRDGNSFMVVTDYKAFVYNRSRHEWQETDMPSGGGAQGGRRQPIPCTPRRGDGDGAPDGNAVVRPLPNDADQIDDVTEDTGGGRPPRSVVVVLDASGSMGDNNKIEDAKAAAKALMQSLSGAEVALIIYYDCTSIEVHEFTRDPSAFEAIIDNVYASGGTPLYVSIGIAYDLMEKKASADSGDIIVLTDGGESCQDDEDRNRQAAASWSQRRIPWVRRTQKQSSSAPGGDLQATGGPEGGQLGAIAGALFFPEAAYAQQAPGQINLHLVGFQIPPEIEAQLQEMMNLAQGSYYPAGDVNQLTQALRTAAGTATPRIDWGSMCIPLLAFAFLVALAAICVLIWRMTTRRQPASAGAPMMGPYAGQIVVRRGQAALQAVGLEHPVITIGRDPANTLPLMDPQVARYHARIRRQDSGATIHDLGSVNGTHINGQRISGAFPLNFGDVITVGNTELVFQAGGVEPTAPYAAPQAGPVGARLMIVQGTSQPPTFDLQYRPVIVLGREASSDIVIPHDSQVSRHHAQIRLAGQVYEVTDLGSLNGLFVNGQRVPRATLRPGDRIRVGDTEFVFQG